MSTMQADEYMRRQNIFRTTLLAPSRPSAEPTFSDVPATVSGLDDLQNQALLLIRKNPGFLKVETVFTRLYNNLFESVRYHADISLMNAINKRQVEIIGEIFGSHFPSEVAPLIQNIEKQIANSPRTVGRITFIVGPLISEIRERFSKLQKDAS